MAAKQPESKTESQSTGTAAELDAAVSLERIAVALERIADRYTPVHTVRSIAGSLARHKQCANGHQMQPTDDYCQECLRQERNPKPVTGNDAA